jgi:hypothetical protein
MLEGVVENVAAALGHQIPGKILQYWFGLAPILNRLIAIVHKNIFEKRKKVGEQLSEATACARRCRSSRLTGWWKRKE